MTVKRYATQHKAQLDDMVSIKSTKYKDAKFAWCLILTVRRAWEYNERNS